jgi:hypothetical protein
MMPAWLMTQYYLMRNVFSFFMFEPSTFQPFFDLQRVMEGLPEFARSASHDEVYPLLMHNFLRVGNLEAVQKLHEVPSIHFNAQHQMILQTEN